MFCLQVESEYFVGTLTDPGESEEDDYESLKFEKMYDIISDFTRDVTGPRDVLTTCDVPPEKLGPSIFSEHVRI